MKELTSTLVDLSMPVQNGMAVLPGHAHTAIYATSEHETMSHMGCTTTFRVESLLMSTHEGTHVDVPLHCEPEGSDVAGVPLESFTGPAVCLDLTETQAEDLISRQTLEDALERAGLSIPSGGYVLLRTGHAERWYGSGSWFRHTGLDRDAAEWLAATGIVGVGLDAPSVDSSREYRRGLYPAHRALLLEAGVLIVENLVNLAEVSGRVFHYYGWPLLVPSCGGSPIRAVAALEA